MNTCRTRVLMVGAAADRYGADAMLRYTATSLSTQFEADVVIPTDGPLKAMLAESGVRAEICPTVVARKSVLGARPFLQAVFRAPFRVFQHMRRIQSGRYAIVYVNTVTIPLWTLAARLGGAKLVVHVHEILGHDSLTRRIQRKILYAQLALAHQIICVSEAVAKDIESAYPKLRRRSAVLLNANFEAAAPEAPGTRIPQRSYDLLVVGRLSPRKGQHVVLEALELLDSTPAPRVAFVGDTFQGYEWYEQELRDKIRFQDLNVDLLGYLPTDEAMSHAPVVVVPSTDPDPAPLVVIEAMSRGKLVVGADVGGIPELLGENQDFLFAARDSMELSRVLERVGNLSVEELEQHKMEARCRSEQLSAANYWTSMVALLEKLEGP